MLLPNLIYALCADYPARQDSKNPVMLEVARQPTSTGAACKELNGTHDQRGGSLEVKQSAEVYGELGNVTAQLAVTRMGFAA